MRRREFLTAAAAGATAFAGTASHGITRLEAVQRPAASGDIGLVNGKFVDGRGMIASALTVKNGRIVNVGQATGLAADAPVIDLGGRTVIPGLFDSHVHYTRAGVNPGYEARRIER